MKLYLCVLAALVIALPAAHAERFALLVQVAEYKDAPPMQTTDGEQIDVPLMKEVLRSRFGFERIATLMEKQAKRAAILSKLDDLATKASPDDAVVFYFSGHGASAHGRFSLCPWDADRKSPVVDITEDDLRQWIEKCKTRNLTLILDCCFSDAPVRGTRGILVRPKFMGREETDLVTSEEVQLPREKAVVLTAASQNEIAAQGNFALGKWAGVYTHCLVGELRKANKDTTYSALCINVKKSVATLQEKQRLTRDYVQTPAIFGSPAQTERRLFEPPDGGPPAPADLPPYATIVGAEGGVVRIDQGSSAGVTVGSRYAVFPAGETRLREPARQVGEIEITSVERNTSVGKVCEGTDAAKIRKECRVVQTTNPVNVKKSAKAVLRLEAPDPLAGSLTQALGRLGGVRVVRDKKQPVQVVLKAKPQGGGIAAGLLGPDGATPFAEGLGELQANSPKELVDAVEPALTRLMVLRALAQLNNPNPAFSVKISTSKPLYAVGDELDIRVTADRESYLILINVDSQGNPTLLFPSSSARDNRVEAGREYRFPPSGSIQYVISAPVGRETLIAVAVADAQAARALTDRLLATLSDTGSIDRGVTVVESLDQVQLGPLRTWTKTVFAWQTVLKGAANAPGGDR